MINSASPLCDFRAPPEGRDSCQVTEEGPRPWTVSNSLTLQAVHVLVTVILGIRADIVPVTIHQQDGSIPIRPPHPLPLSGRKYPVF